MEGWIDIGDMIRNLKDIYQQAPDGWDRNFSDYTDALENLQKIVDAYKSDTPQHIIWHDIGEAVKVYKNGW